MASRVLRRRQITSVVLNDASEGILKNISETVTLEAPLSASGLYLGKVLRCLSLLFLSPYLGVAKNRQL
jgi:hypothetical protein